MDIIVHEEAKFRKIKCDVWAMWDPIYDDNLSSLDPFHANQTNHKYFDMFLTFSVLNCKVFEVKCIFSLNFTVLKV